MVDLWSAMGITQGERRRTLAIATALRQLGFEKVKTPALMGGIGWCWRISRNRLAEIMGGAA
jgi:hypothetical protein